VRYLLAVAIVGLSSPALAEERSRDESSRFRLGPEIDPLPFFAHGFSVHAELKPDERLRVTLGAFGFRRSPTSGPNEGFTADARAAEVSVEYFVVPWSHGGLFTGLYVFFQRFEYSRDDTPGSADAYWLTPAPAAGFQWLPWKKGPYLTPWAALGFPIRRGSHQVGAHVFDESGLYAVLALHIGYEFEI
jgi:hypothetical protein